MARRRLPISLLACLGLTLFGIGACNLFNPSGEGELEGDASDLVAVGEARMRERDFQGAYEAFSKALEANPRASLAWHGLSKASVARDSLPITDLIRRAQELGNLQPGDKMPFLTEADSVKNRFYKPLLRLQDILSRFRVLDSLGATDGVYRYKRSQTDLLIAANLGLVMKLGDLNRDTLFDSRDNLLKGAFDSLSSGGIKPSAISADSFLSTGADGTPDTTGAVSPQKVADFNLFLGGMSEDLETNRTVLKEAIKTSAVPAQDSSDSAEDINVKIDNFLENAGGAIVFWKLNDSIDNDGDGCTDEDVWGDQKDNDGDGIIDEDARASYLFPDLVPTVGMPFARAPDDGIRNDRNRTVGDSVKFVTGTDDDDSGYFVWADDKGRTRAFASLVWADPTQDSVHARILREIPTKSAAEQLEKTRNTIRLQVLALPPARRIVEGSARIGGCWRKMLEGKTR